MVNIKKWNFWVMRRMFLWHFKLKSWWIKRYLLRVFVSYFTVTNSWRWMTRGWQLNRTWGNGWKIQKFVLFWCETKHKEYQNYLEFWKRRREPSSLIWMIYFLDLTFIVKYCFPKVFLQVMEQNKMLSAFLVFTLNK